MPQNVGLLSLEVEVLCDSTLVLRRGAMKLDFDAELRGADDVSLPVHCEIQTPYVGGQKSTIHVAVGAPQKGRRSV